MKNDIEEDIPTIPQDIITFLEKILPPRDYDTSASYEEVLFYSGKRAVIQLLKSLNDRKY